jgi:hypothetical protein
MLGNGLPSLRAWFRTLAMGRLNMAAALKTDSFFEQVP